MSNKGKFEHRNGSGTLFINEYKESANHPDYKGEMKTPDGKTYEIAGWVKQGQKGDFISLSIQEPYVKEGDEPSSASGVSDDTLPFD